MDRGAWWATVHSVTKSQTQLKQLSTQHTKPGLDKHLILEEIHHQLNSKGQVKLVGVGVGGGGSQQYQKEESGKRTRRTWLSWSRRIGE